jgi:hypothetical protein
LYPGPGQVKNFLLGVQKVQNGGDIQDGRQRKICITNSNMQQINLNFANY